MTGQDLRMQLGLLGPARLDCIDTPYKTEDRISYESDSWPSSCVNKCFSVPPYIQPLNYLDELRASATVTSICGGRTKQVRCRKGLQTTTAAVLPVWLRGVEIGVLSIWKVNSIRGCEIRLMKDLPLWPAVLLLPQSIVNSRWCLDSIEARCEQGWIHIQVMRNAIRWTYYIDTESTLASNVLIFFMLNL